LSPPWRQPGSIISITQAPLVDLRPVAVTSVAEHAPQQVEARLWQDPIDAVEKSRGKSNKQRSAQPCEGAAEQNCSQPPEIGNIRHPSACSHRAGRARCRSRRRIRYAVAGLERSGYVPKDEQHIKWFSRFSSWRHGDDTADRGQRGRASTNCRSLRMVQTRCYA
jgi:hypothetical protein